MNATMMFRSLFLATALLAMWPGQAPAMEVRQPNGELVETVEDLRVKVLGGHVVVQRTWQAENQNQGQWRWLVNPAWDALDFEIDVIDGTPKSIRRSGATFKKSGTDNFVLDDLYVISRTTAPAGWRWRDHLGNWVQYQESGAIVSYGDRNNVEVKFTTDGSRRVTAVRDHFDQPVLTLSYTNDRLTSVVDRTGRQVQYQYSGELITGVTDVLGHSWTYAYAGGRMTGRTDPEGRVMTVAYSGNRVSTLTDAEGFASTYGYEYDRSKREYTVTMVSPEGRTVRKLFSADGRVLREEHGSRVVMRLTRDGKSVDIVENERGLRTRTEFDANRNPVKIVYPDGAVLTSKYQASYSLITELVDTAGIKTTYAYDSRGNLTTRVEAVGLPEARTTTFTYDSHGQMLTRTVAGYAGAPAATTTWTYDNLGNLQSETDPLSHVWSMTHDVMGNVLTMTNPRQKTTTSVRNAAGWLQSITDPATYTVTMTYDDVGNLLTHTDQENHQSQLLWNDNDWLVRYTDPTGAQWNYNYDDDGRLLGMSDPVGVTATYSYDADGRLVTMQDSGSNTTTLNYGTAGNGLGGLVASIQFPTYEQRINYDTRDRPTRLTRIYEDPLGPTTKTEVHVYGYDARGLMVSSTDALGRSTLTSFDGLGRLTENTDPAGGKTRMVYDSRDNLVAVINARNATHSFEYDLADRMTIERRPLGQQTAYTYDNNGNLTLRLNALGQRREATYDDRDLMTAEAYFLAGAGTASRAITYTYNPRALLSGYAQTGDTPSTASYTYDNASRRTRETINYGSGAEQFQFTWGYNFRPNGQKASILMPDGTSVAYTYTSNNELATMSGNGALVTFSDHQWGQPRRIVNPGTVENVLYDGMRRMSRQIVQTIGVGTAQAPVGPVLMDRGYHYDAVGNITSRDTEDGTFAYTYDLLDRLTSASPPASLLISPTNPLGLPQEAYQYDAVGNRTASQHQPGPWTYNANDELLGYGVGMVSVSNTFDADGNTTQTSTGDPVVSTRDYVYGADERLIEVNDSVSGVTQYGHDPFGRRIMKRGGSVTKWYAFGDEGVLVEVDSTSGTTDARFIWRPLATIGDSPSWTTANSVNGAGAKYVTTDNTGVPQIAVDSIGAIRFKGVYQAFGELHRGSSDSADYLGRFVGQIYDPESGLHHNFFRDYDPQISRYVQRDPVGLMGGVNTYIYGNANPIKYIDPFGLATCRYRIRSHSLTCESKSKSDPTFIGPHKADVTLDPSGIKSGAGPHENNPESSGVSDWGPIPPGTYTMTRRLESDRQGWWGLKNVDEENWNPLLLRIAVKLGMARTAFNLHLGNSSMGCITVNRKKNQEKYEELNNLLMSEEGQNTLIVTDD